jgi:hypothetical protein
MVYKEAMAKNEINLGELQCRSREHRGAQRTRAAGWRGTKWYREARRSEGLAGAQCSDTAWMCKNTNTLLVGIEADGNADSPPLRRTKSKPQSESASSRRKRI